MNTINELTEINLKNKVLLQAFSGSGAIGTLLTAFLTKSLEMEQVAVLHPKNVAPVAIVKKGKIENPIRLFQSEQFALMSCEVSIPYEELPEFLEILVDFYIKQGVSYIVPVGGLPIFQNPNGESKCVGVSADDSSLKFLEEKGVELLDEGIIYGSVVETMELCQAKGFKNCFSLMAECDPSVPSYQPTKEILKALGKLFGLEYDEEQYEEIISVIKKRIEESSKLIREETIDKTRESHL